MPSRCRTALVLLLAVSGCVQAPPSFNAQALRQPQESQSQAIARLMQVSSTLQRSQFVRGNGVSLLENGPRTYAVMLATIGAARTRIDMESYQFDTEGARLFAPALAAKARQGVGVHLLYDAWGSMSQNKALFDGLRAAGVQVVEYAPIGSSLDINHRDHRKLLVVDGKIAITGGINVTGSYLNEQDRSRSDPEQMRWRDTDVRIDGPAVAEFSALFAKSWNAQHGPPLPPTAPPDLLRGNALVEAIDGAPVSGHPVIYETLLSAIALSKRSVHLTTGYFAPPPELQRALIRAARRGVDIALVVPAQSDSNLAVAAGRAHYHDLLEAGVRLYELHGAVLHAKTATVDGLWSVVGSSNLDWRSAAINNEIDAVIISAEFATDMEAMFKRDIDGSRQVTPEAWANRGLGERTREWFARLIEEEL